MRTIKNITTMVLFFALVSIALAAPVIEEGHLVDGAVGLLKKDPKTDAWTFTPDEAIALTEEVAFPAGQSLTLLPCSVLEQMVTLAGDQKQLRVELSALFTTYKRKNALFSVFFLPMKDDGARPAQPDKSEDSQDDQSDHSQSPKADSIIPTEILKQIKKNKAPDLKKFQQIANVTGDTHLTGRAGFLSKADGHFVFSPDAFGQKINSKQFVLLGNSMLAAAERQMAREPGRERYNVSGLVTVYKGKTYMLLRRASRTYTHGNFTP